MKLAIIESFKEILSSFRTRSMYSWIKQLLTKSSMYLEKTLKIPLSSQPSQMCFSPLRVFVLVNSHPECWKEIKMPTDSLDSSHKTQIYKCFVEDIARHSCSKENVEKFMIRLVESFNSQIKFLVNPFDVRKCLCSRDVHLNHWSRWSRNIFRARLP